MRINPEDNLTYTDRGKSYFIREEYSSALIDCEKTLLSDPNNIEALFLRASIHYKFENFQLALTGCD